MTFYDDADVQLACAGLVSDVRKIKSVGTYANTSRAVEVAVAVGGNCAFYPVGKDCDGEYCFGDAAIPSDTELFTAQKFCNIMHNGGWAVVQYAEQCGTTLPPTAKMKMWVPPYYSTNTDWAWITIGNCGDGAADVRLLGAYCCTIP